MEKLVIIGISEENSYVNGKPAFEKVREVVEKYRPVFILSEQMENNNVESDWNFKQILKKKKLSAMTSLDDVKELIKLAHKNNAKLIGIDFENFLLDKEQQLSIKKHKDASEEEKEELESLNLRRENKHAKMIGKYLALSRKPVVAIVPARELRKKSKLRQMFTKFGDGSRFIYPVNGKNEIVTSPSKEKLMWVE